MILEMSILTITGDRNRQQIVQLDQAPKGKRLEHAGRNEKVILNMITEGHVSKNQ